MLINSLSKLGLKRLLIILVSLFAIISVKVTADTTVPIPTRIELPQHWQRTVLKEPLYNGNISPVQAGDNTAPCAESIYIENAIVSMQDITINSDATALTLLNSAVTITNADLHGLITLHSDNSKIDAAGLNLYATEQAIKLNNDSALDNYYLTLIFAVELSSINGTINDEGSSGRLSYDVVNGKIKVKSRAEEVSVSTVNGDAELELNGTKHLKLNTVNGEVGAKLTGSANPHVSGSSVSGDIKLELDNNASARINIKASAGGSIDNKLSSDKASKAKYGPARSLQFTLGNGDGSVELSTVSGDIELKKL